METLLVRPALRFSILRPQQRRLRNNRLIVEADAKGVSFDGGGGYSTRSIKIAGEFMHGKTHNLRLQAPFQFRIRRHFMVSTQCTSSSSRFSERSGTEKNDNDDYISRLLKEAPSRVEPRYLVGDKLYTHSEKELLDVPLWKKALSRLSSQGKNLSREKVQIDKEVQDHRPVFLADLLREYKGNLYVPEEAFSRQASDIEKFNQSLSYLPELSFEDFLKAMKSDQIELLLSEGVTFIVNLKSPIPGRDSSTRSWAMHLNEDQAQFILSEYKGRLQEIKPYFVPQVVSPPPTPNPMAAAISGRVLLELTAVASLISTALFSLCSLVSGAVLALSKLVALLVIRILWPIVSPIVRPIPSFALAIISGTWRTVMGTAEGGARKGFLGFLSLVFDFVTSESMWSSMRSLLAILFVLGVMAALAKFTLTRRSKDHSKWDIWQAIEFGQSKPHARVKGPTGVRFEDVAGIDDVVHELQELVAYLKEPEKFTTLSTKPPHGVLLEGPPGCGKTLLAKAIAGEAGVPFYQMAGSEFVEVLVGVGASRIRDLFKRAQVNRPAVVFIDEIDALGGVRQLSKSKGKVESTAGAHERETTLNQLLIELDGFDTGTGVIFLGATNRADLLDTALMRPGRFDRRISISPPEAKGRHDILKVHTRKVNMDSSVDLLPYANNLQGWSGAELAQFVEEAALVALRQGHQAVLQEDFDAALVRLTTGPELVGVVRRTQAQRRMAVVELGMAFAAHLLRRIESAEIETCNHVSIVPREESFSRTVFNLFAEDSYMFLRRPTIIHRMQVMLAARAAEELMYGHETSSLSAPYLADASWLALKVLSIWNLEGEITMHGCSVPWERESPFGPPMLFEAGLYTDYNLVGKTINPNMDHEIAVRTHNLLNKTYQQTISLLRSHEAALTKAVHVIMQKEVLSGDEIELIIDKYPADTPVNVIDAEQDKGALPDKGSSPTLSIAWDLNKSEAELHSNRDVSDHDVNNGYNKLETDNSDRAVGKFPDDVKTRYSKSSFGGNSGDQTISPVRTKYGEDN